MTKATSIEQVAQFLRAAEETGISITLLKRHNQLAGEKGVSDSELTELHQSGLYTDLLEAAERGTLNEVDRTVFRHVIGLDAKENGSYPVITVTGNENIGFPIWMKEKERDATSPTGTLELEFLELLKEREDYIPGKEMVSRAEAHGADLGFRHALAFQEAYKTEGFGLPSGTWIPFPGTVVVQRDYGHRDVPFLYWDGDQWVLNWDWLGVNWDSRGWLVRPRA